MLDPARDLIKFILMPSFGNEFVYIFYFYLKL